MIGRIGQDIKSFISGKDLVIFAISLALSTQLQTTLNKIIDTMIMPFVSKLTGTTNLAARSVELQTPGGKDLGIKLGWGAALQSLIVFFISLVIMVEIARYVTVHYVPSSTVKFT
jgi:large-conductance mechanosensitive channel